MAGRSYTKLPFYGSTDPEEFLDWKDQMEYELELQDFPEAKKVSRAVLEFEDYACDWWKQYPHKRFIKCWEDLKKAMRKEFVPRQHELILTRRLQRVKQGSKSIRFYYDELSSSMCRANIVDDMADAMAYFKRGLNPNIAATIDGRYARSVQDLLRYATKEEKKIKKLQQDENTWCINECQEIIARLCADLKTKVSSVVDKKNESIPCKKKASAVPKCDSVHPNVKCAKNKISNSKKSIVVQQEDMLVPQVDIGSSMVKDASARSRVAPCPNVIDVHNFRLSTECGWLLMRVVRLH